ncbi:unnamed protein product [Adineta ricciae]|nr:unnamed protein product [Adineta ricciae]
MQFTKASYLFILFHFQTTITTTNSLPTNHLQNTLDVLHNNQSPYTKCQSHITHTQFLHLLSKNRCQPVLDNSQSMNNEQRLRRDVVGGSIDAKALQNTINDNRIMIEYLFNNTINHTVLADVLLKHTNRIPTFTSWRDLVDVICIVTFIFVALYYIICRIGIRICDKFIIWIFRPVLQRVQKAQPPAQNQHKTSTYQLPILTLTQLIHQLLLQPFLST